MARKDICWGWRWNVGVAIAILKVSEPHSWTELIMRGFGLLGSSMSTPVMVCNGLRRIRIKSIKSGQKQLMDARRRRRGKAIRRANDAGRGSSHDFAHGLMGRAIG